MSIFSYDWNRRSRLNLLASYPALRLHSEPELFSENRASIEFSRTHNPLARRFWLPAGKTESNYGLADPCGVVARPAAAHMRGCILMCTGSSGTANHETLLLRMPLDTQDDEPKAEHAKIHTEGYQQERLDAPQERHPRRSDGCQHRRRPVERPAKNLVRCVST